MTLLLKKRGAILLLMLNLFLVFTGIGLVIPIMPKFMELLGINGSLVGLLVAAFSLTQLLFSPLAGRLADAFGRKRMIVAGMTVFAVSEALFGMAEQPWLLFASRLLGGVSAALIMPAVMAYAADVTTREERAAGMGYINAAITTGFIIGPGIGGYIAEFGLRVPFYAAGAAGLIAACLTFFVLQESKPAAEAEAPADAAPSPVRPQKGLVAQLLTAHREPYFLSLIVVFTLSFGLANFETVFGLFVDHQFGFGPKDIAFIITFGSIAGAVVQVTAFGWILNRFGEKRVITTCLLFAGIFILMTLFVHTFWLIFAVTFIVFLAIDILRPAISTQMSMLAKNEQGYVAGLNSAFTSLGNIAGPIIAGVLFDVNIHYPYTLASIVLLLCFAMSLRMERGRPRETPESGRLPS
ncbi:MULTISPECIES: MFS transporter [unclassified Paenibacillus]|uniref:MFS transporter n=1 Tax=unclassified Paenibacillus TaxID=185978 RepID=UPI000955B739|nr:MULTISPECIES: MFS transporter [unclassified Paenibacillus]ASS67553.1 MFS transporter [Paenibacillus sp. RUD330]SIQ73005.1 MFS transporter, DHA1 family, multidrug resistance protein [Paenibacillus sp. RU4X]SIQ94437.1 MFS transporter, DHA1 family, multidrug resistance protein [Paenibacillus sp. RU4T]